MKEEIKNLTATAVYQKLLAFCLKCRKTKNKTWGLQRFNKGKLMLLTKCVSCDRKKKKIYQNEEPSGLLSNLGSRKKSMK